MALLEPIEKEFELPKGGKKTFVLSRFPAVAGREIVTQYPTSAMPKIGDYALNEELMLKLMCYVGVPIVLDGVTQSQPLMLTTRQLIDNHVPDFETLMKIEMAMMEYNCHFFQQGKLSGIFDKLGETVQRLILKTLMDFSQQSSGKN